MATERQQKRKELREKRLQAESKSKGDDRRQNLIKAVAAIGFIAVVGVVVAVVLIASGSSGDSEPAKSTSDIEKLFAGIPQDGTVLGDPKAKVTLVEFGDLQCPACKQFADEAVPEIVDGPIRGGKARFEFRNWPILGPDSNVAAKASLAASLQGRYWQFIETFYAEQGTEGTGYIDDEFLRSVAEKAGVEDLDKWEEDRNDPRWEEEIFQNDEAALDLGFTGTPSLALEDAKGKLTPIEDISPDGIKKAIDQAQ
jgi:protein-disulfide isomerase